MYQIFLMSGIPCSRLSNSVFVVSSTALSNHSQEQPQQVPRRRHGTPLQHLQLQTGGGKSTPPVPPSPLSQGGQDDGRGGALVYYQLNMYINIIYKNKQL